MGYNKQLNDSYRIVYTDTGSTALPDIHTFDHTGVYSLIAKPSQLGKTVPIGFSVVSGGKTTNTTLAEGNYFVEYSELASNIYWNFSFLGKTNSGSDFTAQNTMVTYDKSKGTYTVKTDELSGGSTDSGFTPGALSVKLTGVAAYAGANKPSDVDLTMYQLGNFYVGQTTGFLLNTAKSAGSTGVFCTGTFKCNKTFSGFMLVPIFSTTNSYFYSDVTASSLVNNVTALPAGFVPITSTSSIINLGVYGAFASTTASVKAFSGSCMAIAYNKK